MCNISEKIPCLFLTSREHVLGSISTCEKRLFSKVMWVVSLQQGFPALKLHYVFLIYSSFK